MDSTWALSGDVEASLASVDDGSSLSALLGVSNEAQRFYLIASRDKGDDYSFPAGEASSTEYLREAAGVGYSFQAGHHELDLDIRRIETGETGTPSLPMDIEFFDSDLWNLLYRFDFNRVEMNLQLYGSEILHRMNNYKLRTAPDFSSLMLPPFLGDDRRVVNADSEETGYRLSVKVPMHGSELNIGLDGHQATHNATVLDPDFEMFFVQNFNNTQVDKTALFAEWNKVSQQRWYFELGLRFERVEQSSGEVDAFPARMVDMNSAMWPMGTPPRATWMLRERFNSADRNVEDDNIDWVAKTRYQTAQSITFEIGLAQKTRSPIFQERFLWIPLEINAGLGDGNNYIGNLNLKPEVSRQLELGLDWRTPKASFSPRLYYRKVDDYIQGMPLSDMATVAVSTNANGDPTPLMFNNVDATLYGFDLNFAYEIDDQFRLEGLAAYVRGKRDDIDDNLYRVSPSNIRLGLVWEKAKYLLRFEQVLVARQDKLSASNTLDSMSANNRYVETPGYGINNV